MAEEVRETGDKYKNLITVLSLVIALSGIFTNYFVQVKNIDKDITLKKYEITFLEKDKQYAKLMQQLQVNYLIGVKENNIKLLQENVMNAFLIFYSLEPFIPKDKRAAIYQMFQDVCDHSIDSMFIIREETKHVSELSEKHYILTMKLREALMESLFTEK